MLQAALPTVPQLPGAHTVLELEPDLGELIILLLRL